MEVVDVGLLVEVVEDVFILVVEGDVVVLEDPVSVVWLEDEESVLDVLRLVKATVKLHCFLRQRPRRVPDLSFDFVYVMDSADMAEIIMEEAFPMRDVKVGSLHMTTVVKLLSPFGMLAAEALYELISDDSAAVIVAKLPSLVTRLITFSF